jgi:hypothetical protein
VLGKEEAPHIIKKRKEWKKCGTMAWADSTGFLKKGNLVLRKPRTLYILYRREEEGRKRGVE